MGDKSKCDNQDKGSQNDKGESKIKKGTVGPSCGPSKQPTVEPPVPKKPQLRGLHMLQTRNHMIIAMVLATLIGGSFKFLVFDPKKTQYAEYRRCTDVDELFEEMRSNGIFQGAPR